MIIRKCTYHISNRNIHYVGISPFNCSQVQLWNKLTLGTLLKMHLLPPFSPFGTEGDKKHLFIRVPIQKVTTHSQLPQAISSLFPPNFTYVFESFIQLENHQATFDTKFCVNPLPTDVDYLFTKWRQERHGKVNSESMFEVLKRESLRIILCEKRAHFAQFPKFYFQLCVTSKL